MYTIKYCLYLSDTDCMAQALQCAARRIEALTRKSAHFWALQALSMLALQSQTFDSNTWVVPASVWRCCVYTDAKLQNTFFFCHPDP